MQYIWKDYDSKSMSFVESWLDATTVKATGLDDGWNSFYEYWANEEHTVQNENFWCKVVYENQNPIAVIALGMNENRIIVMEFVVNNKLRSIGKGTLILKELLAEGKEILGNAIKKSEAVIYPSNIASQKAFEKAGYIFDRKDDDGDAFYYIYKK